MDQKENKGFWGGLFRNRSLARKGKAPEGKPENDQRRPAGDGEAASTASARRTVRRKRHSMQGPMEELGQEPEHDPGLDPGLDPAPGSEDQPGPVRVTKSSKSKSKSKSKRKTVEEPEGPRGPSLSPLTDWPPSGMASQEELSQQHALELVARGAPVHRGHERAVPHASDAYYSLYATTMGTRDGDGTDAADLRDMMTTLMTLRIQGKGQANLPWETLEQPSYAFFWGRLRGTVTLNQWASASGVAPPTMALRDSGVEPRTMTLPRILERLQELQAGLEDDDPDLLYRILYQRVLRDPDRILRPHRTLDRQMTDLIMVLSRPGWIDFTNPKNQVLTRFIFDGAGADDAGVELYHKFFHQLLLSVELEMRIGSRQHSDWAKEKLMRQIPPTIQWDLAVARRWRENVRVEEFGDTPGQTRLRYKLKKRQVKQLKRFAQLMKWPNLAETLENLRQRDEEFSLDSISSDSFAYFSGLVLPGPTFPFLIMNTLIDLDPDPATDDLALLSHMHPHCGFQYRNSYTYWSASCIVGKVLAPTCRTVAGWVGPGRPTADLGRSQIARIRARRPRQTQLLAPEDVQSMAERSEALGPAAECYPVHEYDLVVPDLDEVVDTVRIELLAFRPAAGEEVAAAGPRAFDATVQFAIDGVSWPLRLAYDVSFVSAWPCSDGPHPLFFDYVYSPLKVDEIVGVRDWGGLYGRRESESSPGAARHPDPLDDEEHDDEKVLVVEAFGVRDNEVLARAWCSHWGLSAMVADIRKTCVACAIREAYAATLTVLILVENQQDAEKDDE